MRTGFLTSLTKMARENRDVVLVTGDLGFGSFEPFEKEFPNQYINAGIAEQSMAGIAAGLAKAGKIVFVYSIGNFSTLRCLEQIRNDACYHELNVNFVSLGGGFSYGQLGVSHHATEDIAIMRSLPNVTVVAPSNDIDSGHATEAIALTKGVGYLRLEKGGYQPPQELNSFDIGIPKIYKQGEDNYIAVISYGSIISESFEARSKIQSILNFDIIDFHTLSGLDLRLICEVISKYKHVITIEEHQIVGGLSSLISEVIIDFELNTSLKKLAINNELISIVGDQIYLREYCNICSDSIVKLLLNTTGKYDE